MRLDKDSHGQPNRFPVKFEETSIDGVVLIHQTPIVDERGEFARVFCVEEFQNAGLVSDFPQENRSLCLSRGILRGLHYQVPPHSEAKLLRCTRGRIFDVAVDCRAGSKTFLHWVGFELTDKCNRLIYVPPGFAHGYQALEDDCEVSYRASSVYAPMVERQIRFDDPRIGIQWPIPEARVSGKDSGTPWLSDEFKGVDL